MRDLDVRIGKWEAAAATWKRYPYMLPDERQEFEVTMMRVLHTADERPASLGDGLGMGMDRSRSRSPIPRTDEDDITRPWRPGGMRGPWYPHHWG